MNSALPKETAKSNLKWIPIAQRLIQLHPSYASAGLLESFNFLASCFERSNWAEVIVDDFRAGDISSHSEYVPVEKFSGIYSNYEEVPKRNLMARVTGREPGNTIILNGHLDVDIVSTPELWSEEFGWSSAALKDGRLFGRGATDMLSSVAAMLEVASGFATRKHAWKGSIIFLAVTDEEIGGNGTLRALSEISRREWLSEQTLALVGEPSADLPCFQSLGFLSFDILLRCKTRHLGVVAGNESLWPNLAAISSQLLPCITARSEIPNSSELFRLSFGAVQGGVDPAIPLSDCKLSGTLFFPASCSPRLAKELIGQGLEQLIDETDWELCFDSLCFPGSDSSSDLLAQRMLSALGGKEALFPSPCDARLFEHFGIPSVIFGPGNLEQAHSVDEFIEISRVDSFCEQLEEAMWKVLC